MSNDARLKRGRSARREIAEIALALNRIATHLGRRLRRVDDRQTIGRARLSALSVLVFGGHRTMSELAEEEGVTAATMHHVVAGLLDSRLAQKSPDPTDGRKYRIEVSPKGRRLMMSARAARLSMIEQGLASLTPDERRCLARALGLLERFEL
jgi:DNA-binding MarR family transcriptional regulator